MHDQKSKVNNVLQKVKENNFTINSKSFEATIE